MLVVLGSKVPFPPLHTPPVATVKAPAKVVTGLFAQSERSAPAFAVGAGVMVHVTWSLTAEQRPLPTVARVRVTLPAVRSAALGVYTALSVLLFGLYVPVPPLHIPPEAPFTMPARVIAE